MSYPNHILYNPPHLRRNRRHHRNNVLAPHSPLATIATTAAVVYGAYRLGSWAWNAYLGDDNKCQNIADEEEEEEENDLLYEWTADHQSSTGRSSRREVDFDATTNNNHINNDSTQSNRRHSRRSREHWSNAADRSHRPSPPIDYCHHPNTDTTGEDDDVNHHKHNSDDANVVKKATSLATKYMSTAGSAMSAGISAGIRAYEQKNGQSAMMEKERALRMGRCRLEVSRAMMDFLPTLKQAVMKETDVSGETEELKKLRSRRKELLEKKTINNEDCGEEEIAIRERERILWNEIKNKSVTRLVTTIYAHTIIFLMLTVQVNLLGGRLLRDEYAKEEEDDDGGATEVTANGYHASHQTVLTKTYHYLFAQGIPLLAKSVSGEVREALQDWDVFNAECVSLSDVCEWLYHIRDNIEQKEGNTSSLVKFVIPPEGQSGNAPTQPPDDELATYILDETYDLLESPTFAQAEHQCLNSTYDQIQRKVLGKLFLHEEQHRLPLVNVVTYMQKSAVLAFHKPPTYYKEEMQSWEGVLGMMEEPLPSVPNDFLSRLERLESVRELSDVCF
ncbi:hypothetical protein ACHAXH_009967 [Discostella pseudostelligera]